MEKKELEFMERFLNIEKQDFTDFEKRISFSEMCGNMELDNDDIVEIVKSLTERINSFMLRKLHISDVRHSYQDVENWCNENGYYMGTYWFPNR